MTERDKPAVLFVCLGNICRSPMAEGAFREAAEKAGLDARIDSAGTADYHVGKPPDPRAIATAEANGVDISGLRGRQLCADDLREFTHIVALDTDNLEDILARAPEDATDRVFMLMDALPDRAGEPVADPYHGNEDNFAECWRDINEAVNALAPRLAREQSEARP